jgi:hypothetical protein
MSASQSAELRRAHLLTSQGRRVRPRRTRNPIITSTAAFNVATRGNENNFFGCPHHKHEVLATVVGLPHAEQTFTCLMEVFFRGERRSRTRYRRKCCAKTPSNARFVSGQGLRPFRAAEAGACGPDCLESADAPSRWRRRSSASRSRTGRGVLLADLVSRQAYS